MVRGVTGSSGLGTPPGDGPQGRANQLNTADPLRRLNLETGRVASRVLPNLSQPSHSRDVRAAAPAGSPSAADVTQATLPPISRRPPEISLAAPRNTNPSWAQNVYRPPTGESRVRSESIIETRPHQPVDIHAAGNQVLQQHVFEQRALHNISGQVNGLHQLLAGIDPDHVSDAQLALVFDKLDRLNHDISQLPPQDRPTYQGLADNFTDQARRLVVGDESLSVGVPQVEQTLDNVNGQLVDLATLIGKIETGDASGAEKASVIEKFQQLNEVIQTLPSPEQASFQQQVQGLANRFQDIGLY